MAIRISPSTRALAYSLKASAKPPLRALRFWRNPMPPLDPRLEEARPMLESYVAKHPWVGRSINEITGDGDLLYTLGSFSADPGRVSILAGLPPQTRGNILGHELTHASDAVRHPIEAFRGLYNANQRHLGVPGVVSYDSDPFEMRARAGGAAIEATHQPQGHLWSEQDLFDMVLATRPEESVYATPHPPLPGFSGPSGSYRWPDTPSGFASPGRTFGTLGEEDPTQLTLGLRGGRFPKTGGGEVIIPDERLSPEFVRTLERGEGVDTTNIDLPTMMNTPEMIGRRALETALRTALRRLHSFDPELIPNSLRDIDPEINPRFWAPPFLRTDSEQQLQDLALVLALSQRFPQGAPSPRGRWLRGLPRRRRSPLPEFEVQDLGLSRFGSW